MLPERTRTSRLFYRVAYVPALLLVLVAIVTVSVPLPDSARNWVLGSVFVGAPVFAAVAAVANASLGGSPLASVANALSILVGYFGFWFVDEATGNVEPTVHGGGLFDYLVVVPYVLVLGSVGATTAALVAFGIGRALRRLVSPSSVGLDGRLGIRPSLPNGSHVRSLVAGDPTTSARFYRITYWLAATYTLVGSWLVKWNFPLASVRLLGRSAPELLLWSFALVAFAVSVANGFSGGGLAVSVGALLSLVVAFVGVGLVTAMAGPAPESVAFYDSPGATTLVATGGLVYAALLGVVGYALGVGTRDVASFS